MYTFNIYIYIYIYTARTGAYVQLYKPFQGGKRLVDIVIYILVNGERRRGLGS